MSITRLILVRHGAAAYFEQQVVPGPTGCPGLTEEGRSQAHFLRNRLLQPGELPDSAILLCSPLRRAVETASILAPAFGSQRAHHVPDLAEMGVGVADGMTWAEFEARFGSFDEKQEPDRIWAPEGESWTMFARRVQGFLDRAPHAYAGRTVVAVTHGGVIDVTMRVLLGITTERAPMPFNSNTTGLTEWSWSDDVPWSLVRYNDNAHLAGLELP